MLKMPTLHEKVYIHNTYINTSHIYYIVTFLSIAIFYANTIINLYTNNIILFLHIKFMQLKDVFKECIILHTRIYPVNLKK